MTTVTVKRCEEHWDWGSHQRKAVILSRGKRYCQVRFEDDVVQSIISCCLVVDAMIEEDPF